MKTIGKLKLTQLSNAELGKREQNRLLGGARCCICGCNGPSSTADNSSANNAGGTSGLVPSSGGGGVGSGTAS